jgi:hypothetical protein
LRSMLITGSLGGRKQRTSLQLLWASSRHKLRAVIKTMHTILLSLNVNLYTKKRFIGTTTTGFDFLGY